MNAAKDGFVPNPNCTVASGDCFTEGRCLAQCGAWKEKDHEARIKRLEQGMVDLRQRLAAQPTQRAEGELDG